MVTPILENHMEKEMETAVMQGVILQILHDLNIL